MVDILIVNYNTTKLIIDSLDSLFKTDATKYNIIIIDNNSKKEELLLLEEYLKNINNVTILKLPENIGFGRANNEGIKITKGKYVYLLNPDTILLDQTVVTLTNYLEDNQDVGVVGSNIYDENMNPAHSFQKELPSIKYEKKVNSLFNTLLRKILNKGKMNDFNYTDKPIEVGYVTGASMMIRRDVLNKVGLFNPKFFMYSEETELCYRIKNAGYKIINVPDSKIIHLEGSSFDAKKNEVNMRRLNMMNYSRLLYQSLTKNDPIKYGNNYIKIFKRKSFYAKLVNNKIKLAIFNAEWQSMKQQIELWKKEGNL